MNKHLTISPEVSLQQAKATDPEKTVWVSANAGSGKTYVLSHRVIRLLLKGAKPSELLCLTFTKAAAAEMSNRVFDILGQWVMLEREQLREKIAELTGQPCEEHQIERARKLFAIALDTPGGLRIQTIHAFCESLLHQFPLEANVPGHFEMMNDLDQSLLLDTAKRNVILAGLGQTSGIADNLIKARQIASAFDVVRRYASDEEIDKALLQLIHQRDAFMNWIYIGGGDAVSAFAPMWDAVGFERDSDIEEIAESIANESVYDSAKIDALCSLFQNQTGTTASKLLKAFAKLANAADSQEKFTARKEIFLRKDGGKLQYFVSNKFMEDNDLEQDFQDEQALILNGVEKLKTLENLKASEALFIIVEAMLIEYGNLKQRSGLLDFTDLISRAANLLQRDQIANWVQYKLDKGISHVLVDEAQDTSPLQWQIIEAITSEFYAGEGARPGTRTTFVVGDEKQSIYSFQGADPKEFDKQFAKLRNEVSNIGETLNKVPLSVSFRSTEEVLSAVDQVFSPPENRKGLGLNDAPAHAAARRSARGEVLLWPLIPRNTKPKKTEWRAPPESLNEDDAEVKLAKEIARTIKGWIENKEHLPGRAEPIRYGDILILVRKRDRFVSAINAALKRNGLPSAGADRLKLTDHIAVEDMIALGRFAATEIDDIALAGLLKSPLFDFDEEQLFEIAHGRGDRNLKESIADKARYDGVDSEFEEKLAHARGLIGWIENQRDGLPVYEFYARLFAKYNLRQKYQKRLGHEVEEILDGFFQATLDYDNRSGLGIQGFVEWLDSAAPELKREIDIKVDEIHVITTHSSKGLEKPIVFLVDPGSEPFLTSHAPHVINFPMDDEASGYLWQTKKGNRITASEPVYDQIKEAAEEEYRRLLYVGMTRAADRLIICGYRPRNEPKYDHWHTMVEKGLLANPIDKKFNGRLEDVEPFQGAEDNENIEPIRKWVIDNPDYKAIKPEAALQINPAAEQTLPKWFSKVQSEPSPPRPLTPSGIVGMFDIAPAPEASGSFGGEAALQRGNTVHQLLQILPDIEASNREAFTENYFATREQGLEKTDLEDVSRQVAHLLANPEAAFIFGEGSRGEVALTGKLEIAGREHLVRGVIDRLIISKDHVCIVDFKTNRSVPETIDATPTEYLAQMALYRELVRSVFPTKSIDNFLVWTQNGKIMKLDEASLNEQIDSLNKSLSVAP